MPTFDRLVDMTRAVPHEAWERRLRLEELHASASISHVRYVEGLGRLAAGDAWRQHVTVHPPSKGEAKS